MQANLRGQVKRAARPQPKCHNRQTPHSSDLGGKKFPLRLRLVILVQANLRGQVKRAARPQPKCHNRQTPYLKSRCRVLWRFFIARFLHNYCAWFTAVCQNNMACFDQGGCRAIGTWSRSSAYRRRQLVSQCEVLLNSLLSQD